MEPWHMAHLIALGLWGGLVAAEGVVELAPRSDVERRFAATLHYWMDLLIEIPVLAAVVLTGTVLVVHVWPLSPLLCLKVVAGLVAVGANAWCVVHVVRRKKRDEPDALRREGRLVRLTATVGLPFAAVALYLGLGFFAR
jgi:hypothetical protein